MVKFVHSALKLFGSLTLGDNIEFRDIFLRQLMHVWMICSAFQMKVESTRSQILSWFEAEKFLGTNPYMVWLAQNILEYGMWDFLDCNILECGVLDLLVGLLLECKKEMWCKVFQKVSKSYALLQSCKELQSCGKSLEHFFRF